MSALTTHGVTYLIPALDPQKTYQDRERVSLTLDPHNQDGQRISRYAPTVTISHRGRDYTPPQIAVVGIVDLAAGTVTNLRAWVMGASDVVPPGLSQAMEQNLVSQMPESLPLPTSDDVVTAMLHMAETYGLSFSSEAFRILSPAHPGRVSDKVSRDQWAAVVDVATESFRDALLNRYY